MLKYLVFWRFFWCGYGFFYVGFGFCVCGVDAGIMFQDITTLLLQPEAFKDCIDLLVERYREKNVSVVAGEFFLEFLVV